MQADPVNEISQIVAHYAIGELVDCQRDQRGFVNTSYFIVTRLHGMNRRYFLRRYKASIHEEEIRFEHSVIRHVVENGLDIVARVLPTRDGGTYIKVMTASDETAVYYAIFDFLEGEDKYTWIDPRCTRQEIESSAQVLARFHLAVAGWEPDGQRNEPKILDLLPAIKENLRLCRAKDQGNRFDQYLRLNLELITSHIDQCLITLQDMGASEFIQMVNHCDFHPGNLKFQNGQVVGLFDFDWSKMEVRLFDVALAIFYFFVSWGKNEDGKLRLADAARFLGAYQSAQFSFPSGISLSRIESQCLPALLAAANLYVLNWTIVDYIQKVVDIAEYRMFLEHSLNFIHWLNDSHHRAALKRIISKTLSD